MLKINYKNASLVGRLLTISHTHNPPPDSPISFCVARVQRWWDLGLAVSDADVGCVCVVNMFAWVNDRMLCVVLLCFPIRCGAIPAVAQPPESPRIFFLALSHRLSISSPTSPPPNWRVS